jgi:hypothetical protein
MNACSVATCHLPSLLLPKVRAGTARTTPREFIGDSPIPVPEVSNRQPK